MRFNALKELQSRRPLPVHIPSDKLSDYFAINVFTKEKMREYLSKDAFNAFIAAVDRGVLFDRNVADQIATGMRKWASERGATHYTHWFQPLTDGTAEKHDGFIDFDENGDIIERFSGKLLIQQELTPLPSLTEVYATRSRRAVIRLGISLRPLSWWAPLSVSRPSSSLIRVRRWTTRHLC